MIIFSMQEIGAPLRSVLDTMRNAGFPAAISYGVTGEADELLLDSTDWDSAFVRWLEPEWHDVYLLTRYRRGEEEAKDLIEEALQSAQNRIENAGKLIVSDTLRKSLNVYEVQLLPAMLFEEDHPAWNALDILLIGLAVAAEGIIYAEDEHGFFDSDGEALLEGYYDEEEKER